MKTLVERTNRILFVVGFSALILALPVGAVLGLWNHLAPAKYETRECSVSGVTDSDGKHGTTNITLHTIDCGRLTFPTNVDFKSREDAEQYVGHKISVSADAKTGSAHSVTIDPYSIEVIK